MKETISLADELRAIRGGNNSKSPFKHSVEVEDRRAPWLADIERMERSLQDVLRAISQLSGVELPGVSETSDGNGESLARVDCTTLKDRIRNDLEAFSVQAAADVARQAEEQTRAALAAIQNEVSGQVSQVASEFQEKLHGQFEQEHLDIEVAERSKDRVAQLVDAQTEEFARWVWLTCKGTGTSIPAHVEKLLEPYVEEATAKFTESFQQKVQDLIAEQERMSQEKLQAAIQSVETKVGSLENASLQVCEQNADQVVRQTAERLQFSADEALKGLEGRFEAEIESAIGRFQARLTETSDATQKGLQDDHEQKVESFRQRLESVTAEVQESRVTEISSRIAQTAADVIESSVQHLHHQAEDSLEHSREEISAFMKLQTDEVRHQIQDLCLTAQQSVTEDSDRVAERLRNVDNELSEVCERQISASREQLSNVVQEIMGSMTEHIRELGNQQMDEVKRFVQDSQNSAVSGYATQLKEATESRFNEVMERIKQEASDAGSRVAAQVSTTSEAMMRELSDKVNASAAALREEAAQATLRIETAVKLSLEAYRQQLDQITNDGLNEQRTAMKGNITELHNRLIQAAELLSQGDLVTK